MNYIAWFSCGAASAVAAKMAVDAYDATVVYCDTLVSEHPDNARFLRDVQDWIGKEVILIKSAEYANIDEVFMRTKYMSGVAGARCTVEMKKLPRLKFQGPNDIHVFGFTHDEQKRARKFEERNPELQTENILIDSVVTKADCLSIIEGRGIKLPVLYGLGYDHNNCLGCVKATSPKYWNMVRRDFPDVFARRARQSRLLGVKLVRLKGKRIQLDELPDNDYSGELEQIECGPLCQS